MNSIASSSGNGFSRKIPWRSLFLGIIAAVLAGAALRQAQAVLIPLILAWMISQLLAPMVRLFGKGRIPSELATILALIVLLLAFYWIAIFISLSAASFINRLPAYRESTTLIVSNAIRALSDQFAFLDNPDVQKEIRREVTGLLGFMMSMAGNMAGILTSWLAKLVMIFIMTAFMLIAQPYTERKIINAFSPDIAQRISKILNSISRQISRYLTIQFFLSLATGFLVWLSCRIIGVDAAATWGALAFLLNFIPTIGSIVAGIPPILLALLQFPTIWPAFWLFICILAINQIIGSIISPKVMGDQFNLSPSTILLSLIFWGWLWGIAGAFLSVVITSSIKIICENIETLRPISIMMESGRRMPDTPPARASGSTGPRYT